MPTSSACSRSAMVVAGKGRGGAFSLSPFAVDTPHLQTLTHNLSCFTHPLSLYSLIREQFGVNYIIVVCSCCACSLCRRDYLNCQLRKESGGNPSITVSGHMFVARVELRTCVYVDLTWFLPSSLIRGFTPCAAHPLASWSNASYHGNHTSCNVSRQCPHHAAASASGGHFWRWSHRSSEGWSGHQIVR